MARMMDSREKESAGLTQTHFPFLKLPAELRNEIYRLVLLTENIMTEKQKANHYNYSTPADGDASVQAGGEEVGSIRCQAWRTYTMEYQVAILRVNQQIYYEAWSMFQLENFWTVVKVNKPGFGKEMQDRGFPVAVASDLCPHVRFPVMKVTVIFPGPKDQFPSDSIIMASAHLKQLMRALWTATGASEMDVLIHIKPRLTNKWPSARRLLGPFFKLRGIKEVIIMGARERKYVEAVTSAITTTDGLHQSYAELAAGIKRLQGYIKAERWSRAVAEAERHAMLLSDCNIVYGQRFLGIEPGIHIHIANIRNRAAKEIMTAAAIGMAEVTLHLHQYADTLRFTARALDIIEDAPGPLPALTGLITFNYESICSIHLIRARAFMGMDHGEDAYCEIQDAREYMPHSEALASVSQAWQDEFFFLT